MFKFTYNGTVIDLSIDGCFEPNLTTKIVLSGAIKELSSETKTRTGFLEIGCGSGVITVFLMETKALAAAKQVYMSDLSERAIEVAKANIFNHRQQDQNLKFEFKVGSGLEVWKGYDYDMIINDISAISEALEPMSDWFRNAPNNAGIDGIANSANVLEEFSDLPNSEVVMLMPVLSLSNTTLLLGKAKNLGLDFQKVAKQAWPLPAEMVERHRGELLRLRRAGHISFDERFGHFIAETACYRVRKG